jgi:hypothetical protein
MSGTIPADTEIAPMQHQRSVTIDGSLFLEHTGFEEAHQMLEACG